MKKNEYDVFTPESNAAVITGGGKWVRDHHLSAYNRAILALIKSRCLTVPSQLLIKRRRKRCWSRGIASLIAARCLGRKQKQCRLRKLMVKAISPLKNSYKRCARVQYRGSPTH